MDAVVLGVFAFVYAGMILGGVPGLKLDRTGVALLGAIALLATGRVDGRAATAAIDVAVIALLFGLMIVSAQLRLGGFYAVVTQRIAGAKVGPAALLGLVILVTGALSAVLVNDVVCLAVAPVLAAGCGRRGLDPVPYLLGLACASNIGSAATLIGNPQNMLIGEALDLSFAGYLADAALPVVLSAAAAWGLILLLYRGRLTRPVEVAEPHPPPFRPWQTGKGLGAAALLVGLFLIAPWPREIVALAAAGVLLLSRRTASREFLSLVDWQLLVLFVSLFIVNRALADTGAMARVLEGLAVRGVDLTAPAPLFAAGAVLSNVVSNVPATMLLLPAAVHPDAGVILALSTTLAGNLILVGSIANLIVADQAARVGVPIGWRTHARVGIPTTLVTLALAAAWLSLR